jgi:hypothetical protein
MCAGKANLPGPDEAPVVKSHGTAASEKAHVREAWPSWVPEVSERGARQDLRHQTGGRHE